MRALAHSRGSASVEAAIAALLARPDLDPAAERRLSHLNRKLDRSASLALRCARQDRAR